MSKFIDLTGQVYDRLTVVKRVCNSGESVQWLCKCICGNEKVVPTKRLRNHYTRSCGCYNSEKVIKKNTTHDMTGTVEYNVWLKMKARCTNSKNPSYINYGGRGITVCDHWLNSFDNFIADMGKRPSNKHGIDRIDNEKGYYASNCRWTTNRINSQNTRIAKYWIINGTRYDSLTHAAINLNVHVTVISRWCNGYVLKGVRIAPKTGCYSELKYQ